MNILVSACLLGESCRYDGQSKGVKQVIKLREKYNLIPVCPEVLGGLSTPRTPCEIIGNKVISKNGEDRTENYKKGAEIALKKAQENDCKIAVLKANSPSCSCHKVYDGSFSKTLIEGSGITAALLIKNGIRVIDENELEELL